MTNTLNTYLLDLAERAGKSAAQAAILAIGATDVLHFNVVAVDWLHIGEFAAGGAILSILTSLISAPVNTNGTASLIRSIVSAPTITQKKGNTMAPIADDGKTEYTTYEGTQPVTPDVPAESDPAATVEPAAPAEAAPVDAAPAEAAPVVTPASESVDVTEQVQENADGTVTINGVTYHK